MVKRSVVRIKDDGRSHEMSQQYFMFENINQWENQRGGHSITECAKHGLYLIGELLPALWW